MKQKLTYKIVNGLKTYILSPKIINEMIETTKKAASNTFPIPNKVSCAVLTSNGNIFPGAEYRTDIYALSMHAEMTALSHASIHGEPEIIAVTGPNCHACKQILWENAMRFGNEIIVLIKEADKVKQISLSSMMAFAWPLNHWAKEE